MVTIMSSSLMNPHRRLRSVVFPVPVPPEIIIFFPNFTIVLRISIPTLSIEPNSKKLLKVSLVSGNFLIEIHAPLVYTGEVRILIRDPSSNRPSRIG